MKANIWIEPTGNTLRLVWRHEGKKKQLSLGVRDDAIGRSYAEGKKSEIAIDILSGHYDPTLLKYRPRKLGKNPTEITAVELFEKYIPHHSRDRELAEGSKVKLEAIAAKLKQFIPDTLAEKVTPAVAKSVIDRWLESASPQTIKGYIYYLKAAWEWAKGKYHVADPNPWEAPLTRFRTNSKRTHQPKQVEVFSIDEMQAIVTAFKHHKYYSYYSDFVSFLANTGCRFGEAAGLRWHHLGDDYSTVWIGESISRGHHKGTKTGKARTMQLPTELTSVLKERFDRVNPQAEDLVFPSPNGLAIDDHNYRRSFRYFSYLCGFRLSISKFTSCSSS